MLVWFFFIGMNILRKCNDHSQKAFESGLEFLYNFEVDNSILPQILTFLVYLLNFELSFRSPRPRFETENIQVGKNWSKKIFYWFFSLAHLPIFFISSSSPILREYIKKT